ncbi:alpha/beta fold hydrolase [Salidesulfovibrio onnuriiensis]|uniref:alpha/beta fold hydrolase n=1 Tax=Salidesulfovibrio onnuriiensis TaxID=2583823 RepID=UPI0011C97CF9|nr:alpha/beta hydrolase [Salidesulfovibrio onnuriiensis]
MTEFKSVTVEEYQECLRQPPLVAQTALGPVEYADRGVGPVLLSVHGGPGGYDQGLALAECFRKNGFRVIAPSRPGYLGTPLGEGTTPEGQGQVLAAFLDALELGPVAVVGASAGGPPSYALAQQRPDLVSALVEIDSVAIAYTKQQELSRTEEAVYLSRPGVWLMDWFMRHFPVPMVKEFLKSESSLEGHALDERVRHVVDDPVKLGFVRVMTRTMSDHWDRRREGVDNDLALLGAIDRLPMDRIRCPVLLLHGDAEADVPMAHAEYAHSVLADSELYRIRGGSHIGFWVSDNAETAQRHAVNWLLDRFCSEINPARSQYRCPTG